MFAMFSQFVIMAIFYNISLRAINLLSPKLVRDRTGENIDPRSEGLFLYGPRCARSGLSIFRFNINILSSTGLAHG